MYLCVQVCLSSDCTLTSLMFLSIVFSSLFGLFLWKVFFPVPRPILGIYSRAGNRGILKQVFMFLLMKLRKRSKNNSEVGYGVKLTNDPKKLESAQVELNRSSLVSLLSSL